MYAIIGSQDPGTQHMLILVAVDICSTKHMLVLVAVDIYGTEHMLILVAVDITICRL
jgi:hypothetical protein